MLIKGKQLKPLLLLIQKIENRIFNIHSQYKIIKLKQYLIKELSIQQEQIKKLQRFSKKTEDLSKEIEDFEIDEKYLQQVIQILEEIGELNILIPDIKFELEEFESLDLTLHELEILIPFIIN